MPSYTAAAPDGTPIKGTLERIQGCAFAFTLTRDDNGTLLPDYYGETKIYWDTQETITSCDETVYLDENENQWLESQLILTEVPSSDA